VRVLPCTPVIAGAQPSNAPCFAVPRTYPFGRLPSSTLAARTPTDLSHLNTRARSGDGSTFDCREVTPPKGQPTISLRSDMGSPPGLGLPQRSSLHRRPHTESPSYGW